MLGVTKRVSVAGINWWQSLKAWIESAWPLFTWSFESWWINLFHVVVSKKYVISFISLVSLPANMKSC